MGVYLGTMRVGIEVPKYDVLKQAEGCEIRQYAACVAASVKVEEGSELQASEGFRMLARYIGAFGRYEF